MYLRGLFGAVWQNRKTFGHKLSTGLKKLTSGLKPTGIILLVTGNHLDRKAAPASQQNIIERIDITFSGDRMKRCGPSPSNQG